MLAFLTILIMLIVAYAFFMQGVLTAFTMMVNVFLAGLVAFNFWEPIANELEPMFKDTFLQGIEDWLCLIGLFCITLGLLRLATNSMAFTFLEIPAAVQQGGAVICGLLTGYLTAGFLLCVFQTLPLQENFLGFNARIEQGENAVRRILPADRVWLALMRRGSMGPLASADSSGFDPYGSFELRYFRHRRFGQNRDPLPYAGDDMPIEHSNPND